MSKTVATFVEKLGLTWLKGAFLLLLVTQDTYRCNCWLKIVDHWDKRDNSVMCTGEEIKLV